jgi:hypothetical protein
MDSLLIAGELLLGGAIALLTLITIGAGLVIALCELPHYLRAMHQ